MMEMLATNGASTLSRVVIFGSMALTFAGESFCGDLGAWKPLTSQVHRSLVLIEVSMHVENSRAPGPETPTEILAVKG